MLDHQVQGDVYLDNKFGLFITIITRYQAMRIKMNELVRVLEELKQVIRESFDNVHDQNESGKVI